MIWVYVTCFYLWPWRGAEAVRQAVGAPQPAIERPANAACAALSMATATVVTFVFNLLHPNWTVWSSRDISKRLLEKIRRTEAAAG
jgi:hypothetical protein